MKTVQMTLDEDLVSAVDQVAQTLGTTRSAFTRDALREALTRVRERDLERRHRAGYERKPVEPGEFSVWENEQVWGDD
jgi:CopG family transcriptional regulator / antitoxin EndoAI